MKYQLLILLALIFCSCSKKMAPTAANQQVTIDSKPEWVKALPISNEYFIGVGVTPKLGQTPDQYRETARKNALNQIVSQIKVNVQSNSVLMSSEDGYGFREQFNSAIQSSSNSEIEGYEIVSTYEDEQNYWVYYRLNRSQYNESQNQKRSIALNQSKDFFIKAKSAEQAFDYHNAFDFYIKSALSIKQWWNEANTIELNGETLYVENEVISALKRMCDDIEIKCNDAPITLTIKNEYKLKSRWSVYSRKSGVPLFGIPVKYIYPKSRYLPDPLMSESNDQGVFYALIEGVSKTTSNPKIEVRLDLAAWYVSQKDALAFLSILNSDLAKTTFYDLQVVKPLIYLISNELIAGAPSTNRILYTVVKEEFSKREFIFTDQGKLADVVLEINADANYFGQNGNLIVSQVSGNIGMTLQNEKKTIYTQNINAVKGIGLNVNQASEQAYKECGNELKKYWLNKIFESLP